MANALAKPASFFSLPKRASSIIGSLEPVRHPSSSRLLDVCFDLKHVQALFLCHVSAPFSLEKAKRHCFACAGGAL